MTGVLNLRNENGFGSRNLRHCANTTHQSPDTITHQSFKEQRRQEWYQPWMAIAFMKMVLEKEGEPMIEEFGRAPLPTEFGDWTYIIFGDWTNGSHHEMLVFGDITNQNLSNDPILVRMHSACRTNETFHAVNCECRKELHEAMRMIQAEGQGIILYLEQEGRGTGIAGKLAQLNGMFHWDGDHIEQRRDPETGERIDTDRAYKDAGYPSECRDFTVAGEMLQRIGIKSVRLLTNNPLKIAGIRSAGIEVTPVEIHISPDNEIIASDLKSKAQNLGHSIGAEHWALDHDQVLQNQAVQNQASTSENQLPSSENHQSPSENHLPPSENRQTAAPVAPKSKKQANGRNAR